MRAEFEKRGVWVAAISYDSVEILASFSKRIEVSFPLLADPDSDIIRAFGMVSTEVPADHRFYGFAYAGYYLVNSSGVVTHKFFNEDYRDRFTAANILVRAFDGIGGSDNRQGEAKTKHLTLDWSASNTTLRPGQRAALVLDVHLKPGMHLYAPGDHGYMSVKWSMADAEGMTFIEPAWPTSEEMYLPAIDETLPVYHDSLRIIRDIRAVSGMEFPEAIRGLDSLEVRGEFVYQACDARICYPPETVPVIWTFALEAQDLERVPDELRRVRESE